MVTSKTELLSSTTPIESKAESMTPAQACDAAFKYGSSMAGLDGNLTKALKAFKNDKAVMADMLIALNVGYVVKKLAVSKTEATRIVGLLKYNEKKPDDEHRTFEQQRIMNSVRVLWHRPKSLRASFNPSLRIRQRLRQPARRKRLRLRRTSRVSSRLTRLSTRPMTSTCSSR